MILWMTDLHMDYNRETVRKSFYKYVDSYKLPVILSGDLGCYESLMFHLSEMKSYINNDIYFLPGNHDYYHGEISKCKKMLNECSFINYLPNKPYWTFNENTAIMGFTTVCDPSKFVKTNEKNTEVNDFIYINDFDNKNWLDRLTEVFNDELSKFKESLDKIPDEITQLIIVSHPILYKKMDVYGDKYLGKYFLNETTGKILNDYVEDHQDKKFIVLSGHTHMKASYRFDDLRAYSSKAEYGKPSIAGIINKDFKLIWKDLNIVTK